MGHARKPAVTTPVAILVRGVRMTPLCGISIRTGLSGRRGPGYAWTTGRSGVVPADVRLRDGLKARRARRRRRGDQGVGPP
jgi:hypothetical protein